MSCFFVFVVLEAGFDIFGAFVLFVAALVLLLALILFIVCPYKYYHFVKQMRIIIKI